MPQNFESKVTYMPPLANTEALTKLQQQRDAEKQERMLAKLAIQDEGAKQTFNNKPYICGEICPMENVKNLDAFELRSQFIKGVWAEEEIIKKPYGLPIVSCVDMQNCGECLYFQD